MDFDRRCGNCADQARWGRSLLCLDCLAAEDLIVTATGRVVDPRQQRIAEPVYAARYRYRAVRCGSSRCRRCKSNGFAPHGYYAYRTWRAEGVAREKYLGATDGVGESYCLPELRNF